MKSFLCLCVCALISEHHDKSKSIAAAAGRAISASALILSNAQPRHPNLYSMPGFIFLTYYIRVSLSNTLAFPSL